MCAYVNYRQMCYICIGAVYADAENMRMSCICRCMAYGYVLPVLTSLIFSADPVSGCSGSSFLPPARSAPETQDVASLSADVATRYCVMNLPCDPARRGRKDRFAYSLTVVHFRKVANRQKIGSHENSHQVIWFRFYKLGCNCR